MHRTTLRDFLPYIFMGIMFLWLMCERGQGSDSDEGTTTTTITEEVDTILPPDIIIDMGNLKIPKSTGVNPEMLQHLLDGVYVDGQQNKELRERIKFLEENLDSLGHNIRKYKDSVSDENVTLYFESVVEGHLLYKNIDYKLKVPKEIIKTRTVTTETIKPQSGLYVTSGLGGNRSQLSDINLGVAWVTKKDYLFGYDYNLLNQTHSLKVGFKIFKK